MSSTSSNRLAGLLAVALIVANAVSAFPMFAREDAVLQARGSDDSLTNAVRFQRGLPPLPPKPMRRSSLLGWLHADSKRDGSGTTCSPVHPNGTIVASDATSGAFLGYIASEFNDQNVYTISESANHALKVALPSKTSFNQLIDVKTLNGPDAQHKLLGAVGGTESDVLDKGSKAFVYLTATDHRSPPKVHIGDSMQTLGWKAPVESQIWTLDCHLKLCATWVNPDGSSHGTTAFWNVKKQAVYLTSDFDAWTKAFPNEPATQLELSYLPAK